MFHGGPLLPGRQTHKGLSNRHDLLSRWYEILEEPDLVKLATALEIAAKWVDMDGVVILRPESYDASPTTINNTRYSIPGAWQNDEAGLLFPAWIDDGDTRAGTVLLDSVSSGEWPDGYREVAEDNSHLRMTIYNHPPEGRDGLDDGLFALCRNHATGVARKATVQRAAFVRVGRSNEKPYIVCFYSYTLDRVLGIPGDFSSHSLSAVDLLRKALALTFKGVGYRLVAEVNAALSDATLQLKRPTEWQQDAQVMSIPGLIANALGCHTGMILLANSVPSRSVELWGPQDSVASEGLSLLAGEALADGQTRLAPNPQSGGEVPLLREAPPSLLAVPILLDGATVAVIACEGRLCVPRILTCDDAYLLNIIGGHIARSWAEAINRERLSQEAESWRSAVRMIERANTRAYGILADQDGGELSSPLGKVLEIVAGMVSDRPEDPSVWLDIRLLNPEGDRLEYAAFHGAYWAGKPEQMRDTFSVDWHSSENHSLGEYVVKARRPISIRIPTDLPMLPPGTSTRDAIAQQLFVIPIFGGPKTRGTQKCLGVIDLHMSVDTPIPTHLMEMAEMLGHQIGLVLVLGRRLRETSIARLETVSKLNEAIRYRDLHLQILQNVHHQVDSPLVSALAKLDNLMDVYRGGRQQDFERLRAIRAFTRRSWQASSSTNIFRAISSDRPLHRLFQLESMDVGRIDFLLNDMAEDYRHFIGGNRNLRIEVDTSGFKGRDLRRFFINEKMLCQAISNLLDNAIKYSFSGKIIRVIGKFTGNDNFSIAVCNSGIPIGVSELSKLRERGYRTDAAKVHAEGTGIGLWLVDRIMKYLGGSLEINPSEAPGAEHAFQLVFQPLKSHQGKGRRI
jgi:signal transduction histidine kinase/GAF domain-containing protein